MKTLEINGENFASHLESIYDMVMDPFCEIDLTFKGIDFYRVRNSLVIHHSKQPLFDSIRAPGFTVEDLEGGRLTYEQKLLFQAALENFGDLSQLYEP